VLIMHCQYRHDGRCRIDVALTTIFREHKAPLYAPAFRAYGGMMLVVRDHVVLGHVHQDHFTAARCTAHLTHSDYNRLSRRAFFGSSYREGGPPGPGSSLVASSGNPMSLLRPHYPFEECNCPLAEQFAVG
jgi:hypothetical protein